MPPLLQLGLQAPTFNHSNAGRRYASHVVASISKPASERTWRLSVELPIGKPKASEQQLLASSAFFAQVQPDLPFATSWQGILKSIGRSPSPADQQVEPVPCPEGRHNVLTVGAQMRSEQEVAARMRWATGGAAAAAGGAQPPADALLCVSGSHPARLLPFVTRFYQSTPQLLRLAQQLQATGEVAPSTQLWATANPNLETSAAYLEAKVEAGAQVILTQPPLVWSAFERWAEDADKRGLLGRTQVLVGAPMLTSPGSVGFWMALCRLNPGEREAQQLLEGFQGAEGEGKEALQRYADQWTEQLVDKVQEIPGMQGLHVMPVTGAGARQALRVLHKLQLGQTAASS